MISNFGFSTVECRNIPVSLGNIAITCQYGTVGKIFEYGVNNPDSGSPIDACVNNDENSSCKPTNSRIKSLLDQSSGKERYTVNFSQSDLYTGNPSKMCGDPTNLLFVQYSCVQTKEQQAVKYEHLIRAVATTCLISLLFVLVLQKLYKGGKIQQLEWDISTVTAGDYTVEFDIDKNHYSRWHETYNQSGGECEMGYAPALSLKRKMIEEIEAALRQEIQRRQAEGLTSLDGRKTTEPKEMNENVSVADMVFSYNNSALIHALKARGSYIGL